MSNMTGNLHESYEDFIERTTGRNKTSDDCYTPDCVMQEVFDYVARRWDLDPARFVRPFYPGGDYEHFEYPDGCVVVDNPPFSIIASIERFYLDRGQRFFLFAPGLVMCNKASKDCLHIVINREVKFTNGHCQRIGFVTNLPSPNVLEYEPAFDGIGRPTNPRAKLTHSPRLWTVSRVHKERTNVPRDQVEWVNKENGRDLFGAGYMER